MNTLGDVLRLLLINLVSDENEEGVELKPGDDGIYDPKKLLHTIQQTMPGATYKSIEDELKTLKTHGMLSPSHILDIVEKTKSFPHLLEGKRRRYVLLIRNSINNRF